MKIRLASPLQPDSIVDGEGIRTVIWAQGCGHRCKGCHNPSTHDFNGGYETTTEEIIKELSNLEGQDGITLSGGDPLFQPEASLEIAKAAKKLGLNVWCYTGFTYENLVKKPQYRELLESIDVLVDGKFVEELKSLNLDFRGSKNQRVIDVPKSLKTNKVVLVPKYIGERYVDVSVYHQKHVFV